MSIKSKSSKVRNWDSLNLKLMQIHFTLQRFIHMIQALAFLMKSLLVQVMLIKIININSNRIICNNIINNYWYQVLKNLDCSTLNNIRHHQYLKLRNKMEETQNKVSWHQLIHCPRIASHHNQRAQVQKRKRVLTKDRSSWVNLNNSLIATLT